MYTNHMYCTMGIMLVLAFLMIVMLQLASGDVNSEGVIMPSKCEVCKYLVIELQYRLDETGKYKEVIRTGHGLDPDKKKAVDYRKTDLRLIEALTEPHVCKRILEYNLHKERKGSLRFAKGRSQTMDTLHDLKDKGVKVELGIPYELWDSTSVEVAHMQKVCDNIVEQYEDDIEDWYYNHQEKNLMDFLCRDRVLKYDDADCLSEVFVPENEEDKKDESEEKKAKKKSKKKGKKNLKGEEASKEDIINGADETAEKDEL